MKAFEKLDVWSERNHSPWMDILRMILGVALIAKGFLFMSDITPLIKTLDLRFGISNTSIALFIGFIHLLAGFLILIGLATRMACLAVLPILFAAIFFVNIHVGVNVTELISSIVIFFLLIFFFLKGSGKFSVYYYVANSRRSREKHGVDGENIAAPLSAGFDHDGNFQ